MVQLIESIISLIFGAVIVVISACTAPDVAIIVLGSLLALVGILGVIFYCTRKAKRAQRAKIIATVQAKAEEHLCDCSACADKGNTTIPAAEEKVAKAASKNKTPKSADTSATVAPKKKKAAASTATAASKKTTEKSATHD